MDKVAPIKLLLKLMSCNYINTNPKNVVSSILNLYSRFHVHHSNIKEMTKNITALSNTNLDLMKPTKSMKWK